MPFSASRHEHGLNSEGMRPMDIVKGLLEIVTEPDEADYS